MSLGTAEEVPEDPDSEIGAGAATVPKSDEGFFGFISCGEVFLLPQ